MADLNGIPESAGLETYGTDALAAIHETASDLHDAGVIDKRTLREFDELCLTQVRPMTAEACSSRRPSSRDTVSR